MSEQRTFELLADLARLLNKYGPEPFEALARLLSTPEFPAQLAAILSQSARAAREATSPNQGPSPLRSPGQVRTYLDELRQADPERARLLRTLYDHLLSGLSLPTLREIRNFAVENGLAEPVATTRNKAVVLLVSALRDQPKERLETLLAALPDSSVNRGNSLADWARIILDKDLRKPQTGT